MIKEQVVHQFAETFDHDPELLVYAPGRANLIGEHTDYNEGWVFPIALSMGTYLAVRRRNDTILHTVSPRFDSEDQVDLRDLNLEASVGWVRFVRGVAALLINHGCDLVGADILVDSELPSSSGLSSSAALELGFAVALTTLTDQSLDRVALARLGQQVENEIVGVQSGLMDQLAVACGVADHALLIDCRTVTINPIRIPSTVRVLVLDSAVSRTLVGSVYNQRREECASALRALQSIEPSLQALRDVTPDLLDAGVAYLSKVEHQRVRHVVTENQRVQESAVALQQGDVARFGALMVASHTSLRNDYEVSSIELDTLVAAALDTPGVLGARLTGAGFGGCAVALVETPQAEQAAETIIEQYQRSTGRVGTAYICTPQNGVHASWIDTAKQQTY